MNAEADDVAEQADDAGGEHLVQRLDVAGEAGHEPPDRRAIEERRAERQHVAVDAHAQIVHAALADHLREVDLREGGAVLADEGEKVEQADAIEPGQAADRDVLVDRLLEQVGLRDLAERDHGEQGDGPRELGPVGPDVAEDAPEQRPVERLAEEILGRGAPAGAGDGAALMTSPRASASAASCSR